MKWNCYKLKRTAKHQLVILRPDQYRVVDHVGNIMRVKVLDADGVEIRVPHSMVFRLSKKGNFYINGSSRNTDRRAADGAYITYAIPA